MVPLQGLKILADKLDDLKVMLPEHIEIVDHYENSKICLFI